MIVFTCRCTHLLYLSISIFCYCILLLHHNSEKILYFFTSLHLCVFYQPSKMFPLCQQHIISKTIVVKIGFILNNTNNNIKSTIYFIHLVTSYRFRLLIQNILNKFNMIYFCRLTDTAVYKVNEISPSIYINSNIKVITSYMYFNISIIIL